MIMIILACRRGTRVGATPNFRPTSRRATRRLRKWPCSIPRHGQGSVLLGISGNVDDEPLTAPLPIQVDQLTADIAKLSEELSDLANAIAEIDAAVAAATEQRQDEKAKNTQTVKDSQEAQTAVAQASRWIVAPQFLAVRARVILTRDMILAH